MTANNPSLGTHNIGSASGRDARTGLFSRILASLVAGREDKGRHIANNHLSLLNDSQLSQLGCDKARIAEIRKSAGPSVISF